jgi:hypothetical protein
VNNGPAIDGMFQPFVASFSKSWWCDLNLALCVGDRTDRYQAMQYRWPVEEGTVRGAGQCQIWKDMIPNYCR